LCSYCGHRTEIRESYGLIVEHDYYSALQDIDGRDDTAVSLTVKCDSCAAEFDFDPNVHADDCPFCGTRIVVDSHETRHFRPQALLPFRITAEQAVEDYRKWLKRLWFAPGKLKKYARKDSQLNGMYVPYWTYDTDTYSRYTGERGTIYQEPQRVRVRVNGRWTTQTRMVTKIRWTPVSGDVSRRFDDFLVFASQSLPRDMARELAPWDLENLKPYAEEFLSGFRSEVYQVDLKNGFDIARERMQPIIRSDIARDIGGDHQRIHRVQTQHRNIRFKHILLPFWIAGFRFRNKTYRFIVNGRTGEVQGERPYSIIKIALAVLLGLIAVLVVLGLLASGDHQSGNIIIQDWPEVYWPSSGWQ
jgi:DNA-directed RNA polymerase subunit RPC12/RpoP